MKSQAQIVMSKAWEIRREAAGEQEVSVSEIHFGECLKAAWAMIKKYGYDLVAKVDAIMSNANGMVFRTAQAVDSKIWEMKEVSGRMIKEIDHRYQAI